MVGRAVTIEQKAAILDRILEVWCRSPTKHLRLCQLMHVAAVPKLGTAEDLFYVEDEEIAQYVEEFGGKNTQE